MRYHELTEAPIEFHTMDYKDVAGRPDSFQKDDRTLFASKKGQAKINKIWHSSVCDVVCYAVNVGENPGEAFNIAYYGHNLGGEKGEKGDLVDLHIDGHPDKITVVFTNNEGAARIPLTGWMIAHRLFHAFSFTREGKYHGGNSTVTLNHILKRIEDQFYGVMGDIRGSYSDSLSNVAIAHAIGTTKACRDKNLTGGGELLPEAFAQFMLKGRVTLNQLPHTIKGEHNEDVSCYQGNLKFVNQEIQSYENYFNEIFPTLIQACKGRIFAI